MISSFFPKVIVSVDYIMNDLTLLKNLTRRMVTHGTASFMQALKDIFIIQIGQYSYILNIANYAILMDLILLFFEVW